MEQSVGQTASMNHAAELDQILASYKVCFVRLFGLQTRYAVHLCYKFINGEFLQS